MKSSPNESTQSDVRPSTSSSSQHLDEDEQDGPTTDAALSDAAPEALLEDELRAVSLILLVVTVFD
jgi:hypothetical protein